MLSSLITIAAGLGALVGILSVIGAARARSEIGNRRAVRWAQASFTAAGLLLFVNAFVGGDTNDVFGGFMLLVFGTGLTAVVGRKDASKAAN